MSMIYPLFAMVLLTFAVAIGLGVTRFSALRNGQTRPGYYRLLQGEGPPERALQFSRNFSNLFEVPVLFYALGALAVGMDIDAPALLAMAWVYVALRVLHSFIHVTYNAPTHRFLAFMLSTLVLMIMWFYLVFTVSVT